MGLFSFFKKDSTSFFTENEKQLVMEAIRLAEQQTSGEVRLFVEHRCRFVNPVDRAAEVFYQLKMEKTANRNAVLVYLATRDRQFAVFADQGIYAAVGKEYWNTEAAAMLQAFQKQDYVQGLTKVIGDIGGALCHHFPYDPDTDKNELPDEIVFGS